nr:MAG TPA: hypothetical protein [Crassvirales sp.]DAK71216.1 MAG TPA: hypothetical protein [Caudoviricetes sp.]DAP79201.1 MAG TPA: hypothetical protein [Caudoviricetes sp.]
MNSAVLIGIGLPFSSLLIVPSTFLLNYISL